MTPKTLHTIVVLILLCFSLTVSALHTPMLIDRISVKPTEEIGMVNLGLQIESSQEVSVNILDMNASMYVENFLEKTFESGNHTETLDLTKLPSGLYTIQVVCGEHEVNQKLIIMSEN